MISLVCACPFCFVAAFLIKEEASPFALTKQCLDTFGLEGVESNNAYDNSGSVKKRGRENI